jgi:hypothetical protein
MAKSPDEVRFDRRVAATIAVAIGIVVIPSTMWCGCHYAFRIEHLVVTTVVVAWGLFALATYRNWRERIIGWIAFAVAAFAWFLEWSMNSIFLFRSRDIIGFLEYLGY